MPGVRCSVSTCNNSRVKTGNTIRYHTIPRNKNVGNIWIKQCQRGGKWNATRGVVCSIHFKEDDYERDLQAELLNLPRKLRLKPTVALIQSPSLKCLPITVSSTITKIKSVSNESCL